MNYDDILSQFCDVTGADRSAVESRWRGRPDHIVEDLFRLKGKDGEYAPIKLFDPWQRQFIHAYFYGDASVLNLLKGRRIGGTAIALICFALEGITLKNQRYPLVSTKEEQAYSRINDLRELFENAVIEIPHESLKGTITLWNGTKFIAYTKSAGGSRGDGARSILFDEMDFMGPPYQKTQQELLRAFRPMLSLSSGKMLQVSTPNLPNTEFMKTNARGSLTGFDEDGNKLGVIAFRQPTFHNADEIDIDRPLYEQHLEPARPDLNIDVVEQDRIEDPMGFRQEYLCIPASDEHLFFSSETVKEAVERGRDDPLAVGLGTPKRNAQRFIFVDVGVKSDDTAIAVADHFGDKRYLRYIETVDKETLAASGIANPDRENVEHIAMRVADIHRTMDADIVMFDVTGSGQFLSSALRTHVGGSIIPFNFSDVKKTRDSFAGMNRGLRTSSVSLPDDRRLVEQLESIVRVQRKDSSVPRFTGKDTAPDGKDDMAVAAVMACYPPGYNESVSTDIASKPIEHREPREPESGRSLTVKKIAQKSNNQRDVAYGSARLRRSGSSRGYQARRPR